MVHNWSDTKYRYSDRLRGPNHASRRMARKPQGYHGERSRSRFSDLFIIMSFVTGVGGSPVCDSRVRSQLAPKKMVPASQQRHHHCSLGVLRKMYLMPPVWSSFSRLDQAEDVWKISCRCYIRYFLSQTSLIGMFRPIFFVAAIAVISCMTFADASPQLMHKLVTQYQENTKQRLPQQGNCTKENIVRRKEW
jgi:hypothetical protein